MITKQLQAYQDNAVQTASGPQLTLMLYNGCVKFIKQAIKDLDGDNYESKNINIQKAQNIIQELMLTLDPEIEISEQMLPIYEFINFQLTEGNIKNETSYMETALEFVIDFRDTWKEMMKQELKGKYVQGAQV